MEKDKEPQAEDRTGTMKTKLAKLLNSMPQFIRTENGQLEVNPDYLDDLEDKDIL